MVKRILLLISRLFLGIVFVFSGFVKAIDPLGSNYKIEDYLHAMGPFMSHFTGIAFIASILLSATELLIGLNLILGVRLKETTWAAALFMVVMTPITLWIAIANPVHDCGCFGDALIITNWQTFWKNIILSAFVVVIFLLRKSHKPLVCNRTQWVLCVYSFLFTVGLSFYCLKHLPIIDFRPYKIGTNIIKGMETPPNAEKDSFDIKLIYAKNGQEKEFSLENYPRNDSSWTFVDQRSVLIKKGYEPPIHDFTIDTDGGEITDIVLNDPGYTFLLISYDFTKADLSKSEQINQIYQYALKNGYKFYALTASVKEDIAKYKQTTKAEYPIGLTDKITLKTIIRSNPGLVLIKNATVLNLWATSDIPEFKAPLESSELGKMQQPNHAKSISIVILIFLFPMLGIFLFDKFLNNRRD